MSFVHWVRQGDKALMYGYGCNLIGCTVIGGLPYGIGRLLLGGALRYLRLVR